MYKGFKYRARFNTDQKVYTAEIISMSGANPNIEIKAASKVELFDQFIAAVDRL